MIIEKNLNKLIDTVTNSHGYDSLFNQVDFKNGTRQYQDFEGSFDELLEESFNALESEDLVLIIARIPQLLRPVLELKQDFPNSNEAYECYVIVIKIILSAYQGMFEKSKLLMQELFNNFSVLQNSAETLVKEKPDLASWVACDPDYSIRSTQKMMDELHTKNIVFVPLANGAIRAGADVFLRYTHLAKESESVMFPVRFSRLKQGDDAPQTTDYDIMFIQNLIDKGYSIVIFEEDSDTGITQNQAVNFFKEKFPDTQVLPITNYDSMLDW